MLAERQPTLAVGILGGTSPGLGRVMVDTGAAFTMITLEGTRTFGLKVTPVTAAFSVASGDTVTLLGTTNLTLQVHDQLQLVLSGVRVHQPWHESSYLFLLGTDVLGGVEGMLGVPNVQTGL